VCVLQEAAGGFFGGGEGAVGSQFQS
jgi:hypothetical protein